jgi:hypothetical protein
LDLGRERNAVSNWLKDIIGYIPHDSYAGDPDSVRDSCLRDIDQCDLYILILGGRYGEPLRENSPENLSMTHLEFRHAGDRAIPRIALLRTSAAGAMPPDKAAQHDRVNAFSDEVQRAVRAAFFTDEASLHRQLRSSLQNVLDNRLDPRVRIKLTRHSGRRQIRRELDWLSPYTRSAG